MSMPVIETKLNIPSVNDYLVKRVSLERRLMTKLDYSLTLMSSFAGSGKSTTMAMHVINSYDNCVWYSLDDSDNDMVQFITYLLTGIYRHSSLTDLEIRDIIEAYTLLDSQSLLTLLINEFSIAKKRLTIIFDDFHLIKSPKIYDLIINLVEHLPKNIHIVIITRVDPPFPLAKWRSKSKLLEIGMSDLKFHNDEVKDFFSKMNLTLSKDDIHLLNHRTEGWISGLQLAAYHMKKTLDNTKFIANFSGNHYYIMAYLLEEILSQQSKQIKEFLLCTSILSKFCAPLCDKIMEYKRGTSQKIITQIQQANLFIIPLDYENKWYRYHYLFSDILNTKLNESKYKAKNYHKLASEWFLDFGDIESAVFHALKLGDIEYTANIIENTLLEKDGFTYKRKFYKLIQQLPESIIRRHPIINIACVWGLIDAGYFDAAIGRLKHIQKQLNISKDGALTHKDTAYDKDGFGLLPALTEIVYAYINATTGETTALIEHTNRALSLLGDKNPTGRSAMFSLMCFSFWHQNDLCQAMDMIDKSYLCAVDSHSKISLINIRLVQIDIRIQIGQFTEAEELLHKMIDAIVGKSSRIYATLELKMAEITLLRGETERAEKLLKSSVKRASLVCLPDFRYKWHIIKSQTLTFNARHKDALEHIKQAQKHYYANPIPDRCSIQSLKNLCLIRLKRLKGAECPIDFNCNISECQKLTYFEYVLNQPTADLEKIKGILKMTESMLKTAKEQKQNRATVDILLYKARALNLLGKKELAADTVVYAIEYAAYERYAAPFIVNFESLISIYQNVYTKLDKRYLLDELVINHLDLNKKKRWLSSQNRLSELLTKREKDILKLLAKGYSNKAICEELFLALSTVKGYNQNIFDKLEVKNRTEAACKARKLGLLIN